MMIPVQTVPTYGDDDGGEDMFDPTMDGNTRSNAAVAVDVPAVAMDLQRSEIRFVQFPICFSFGLLRFIWIDIFTLLLPFHPPLLPVYIFLYPFCSSLVLIIQIVHLYQMPGMNLETECEAARNTDLRMEHFGMYRHLSTDSCKVSLGL